MATNADQLQRIRQFIQYVLNNPDTEVAAVFKERLQALRGRISNRPTEDFNPKVTLALPSCEGIGMDAVEPMLFIEEMLAGKVKAPNIKVVEVPDQDAEEDTSVGICVPRDVAAKMAKAANTERVSFMDSLVERLARFPDQPIRLTDEERNFVRKGGSISRMQHMLSILKAHLQERMRKDPAAAKQVIETAKEYGFDLSATAAGPETAAAAAAKAAAPLSPLLKPLRTKAQMTEAALKSADEMMEVVRKALNVASDARPNQAAVKLLQRADADQNPSAFNSQAGLDVTRSELSKMLQDDAPVELQGGADFMSVQQSTIMLAQLVDTDRSKILHFTAVQALYDTRDLQDVWSLVSMQGARSVANNLDDEEAAKALRQRTAFFNACASVWNKPTSRARFDLGACVASLEPFRSALGTFWTNVDALQNHGTESFADLRASYGSFATQLVRDMQEVWCLVLDPELERDVVHLDPFSVAILAKYTGTASPGTARVSARDWAQTVSQFVQQREPLQSALATCKEVLASQPHAQRRLLWLRTLAKRIGLLVLASILGFEADVMEFVQTALRPWVAVFFQEIMSMVKRAGLEDPWPSSPPEGAQAEATSEDEHGGEVGAVSGGATLDVTKVQAAVAALGSATRPPVQLIHRVIQQRAAHAIQLDLLLRQFRVKVQEVLKGVQVPMQGDTPLLLTDLVGAVMATSKQQRARIASTAARRLFKEATGRLSAQFLALIEPTRASDTPAARAAAAIRSVTTNFDDLDDDEADDEAEADGTSASDTPLLLHGFDVQLRPVPARRNKTERGNKQLVQAQFDAFNAALAALTCATACQAARDQGRIRITLPLEDSAAVIKLVTRLPKVGFPDFELRVNADNDRISVPDHMGRDVCLVRFPKGHSPVDVASLGWNMVEQTSTANIPPIRLAAELLILFRAGCFQPLDEWWTSTAPPQTTKLHLTKTGKHMKDCLTAIVALVRAAVSDVSDDTTKAFLQAVVAKVRDPTSAWMQLDTKHVLKSKDDTAAWEDSLFEAVVPRSRPAYMTPALFTADAPSLDDWKPLLAKLPPTHNARVVNGYLARMLKPWNKVQQLGQGTNTKQPLAKAFVWAQRFVDAHPLHMVSEAMKVRLGAEINDGRDAAVRDATATQGIEPRHMDANAAARQSMAIAQAFVRPGQWLAQAGLFHAAGLRVSDSQWSPTADQFVVSSQDVVDRVQPDPEIVVDMLKRNRTALALSIVSSIKQLVLQQAKMFARRVNNLRLRETIHGALNTMQFDPVPIDHDTLWNQDIIAIFAARDVPTANKFTQGWDQVDNADTTTLPAAIAEMLRRIRKDAMDMWTQGFPAPLTPGIIKDVGRMAQTSLNTVWVTAGAILRKDLHCSGSLFTFPERLTAISSEFMRMCMTEETITSLTHSEDAAAWRQLRDNFMGDVGKEFRGEYLKSARVSASWEEKVTEFIRAHQDTFVRHEDGTIGGKITLSVTLGNETVATSVDFGNPDPLPRIDMRLLACALLAREDMLKQMKETMPLTYACCCILASANIHAELASVKQAGEVHYDSPSAEEQRALTDALATPFLTFPAEFQSALVNSLFRSTDTRWLATQSDWKEVHRALVDSDAFGPHIAFSSTTTTPTTATINEDPASRMARAFMESFWAMRNTSQGWSSWRTVMDSATTHLKEAFGTFFQNLLIPLTWGPEVGKGTLTTCAQQVPMLVLLFFRARCKEQQLSSTANTDRLSHFLDVKQCKPATEECLQWWSDNTLDGKLVANLLRKAKKGLFSWW